MNWKDRPVLVSGGASFIGSHLVDGLIERGAAVRVVDDLTSGQLENIKDHIDNGRVEFIRGDLKTNGLARKVVDGMNVVFHLAADHGGRGYVELHQSAIASDVTGNNRSKTARRRLSRRIATSARFQFANFTHDLGLHTPHRAVSGADNYRPQKFSIRR